MGTPERPRRLAAFRFRDGHDVRRDARHYSSLARLRVALVASVTDLTPGLHLLDPRERGVEGSVQVEIWQGRVSGLWHYGDVDNPVTRFYFTAREALLAARAAAGLGDVAEEPCATYQRYSESEPAPDCFRCRWPRLSHGERPRHPRERQRS